MQRSLWDAGARSNLLARIDRLKPDAAPRWGRMNAPQMVAHVIDWMRMIKGEIATAPRHGPLRRTPVKQLVIYWMPWPKGVPTAPELLRSHPATWDAEVEALREHLRTFEQLASRTEWPDHPAFGKLSTRTWGVLGYRHTDHHFRQFGV